MPFIELHAYIGMAKAGSPPTRMHMNIWVVGGGMLQHSTRSLCTLNMTGRQLSHLSLSLSGCLKAVEAEACTFVAFLAFGCSLRRHGMHGDPGWEAALEACFVEYDKCLSVPCAIYR